MAELTGLPSVALPLAQGGVDNFVGIALVLIIAIISAVANAKSKKAKNDDELAQQERRRQLRLMRERQQPQQRPRPQAQQPRPPAPTAPLQPHLAQPQPMMGHTPQRPSYVSTEELRRAERKARERVRLMSQKAPKRPAPVVHEEAVRATVAKEFAPMPEIAATAREHKTKAARPGQLLAERTAHLDELQRGFVYHEIFSAPRAVRREVGGYEA